MKYWRAENRHVCHHGGTGFVSSKYIGGPNFNVMHNFLQLFYQLCRKYLVRNPFTIGDNKM